MEPDDRPDPRSNPWARLLGVAWVVVAIALLTIAVVPFSAPADPSASAQSEADFVGEEAGDDFESELNEEEEEEEEEEDLEASGTAGSALLPPDCLLRTAQPSVVALFAQNNLRLTLRYTAQAPTNIGVSYWLKGGKGSLQVDSASRHLGERGVLRMNQHLEDRAIAKVRAARSFVVHLDVPETPSYCKDYLTLHLTAKHPLGDRVTWSGSS